MKNILAFPHAKTAAETSFDQDCVMRLQALMSEGKYKVSAERIADRIIDSLKQTIPAGKRKA